LAVRQPRSNENDEPANACAGDLRSAVHLSGPETLARGFRTYERFSVTPQPTGAAETCFEREVLRSGPVVAVLPVDFVRREILLIRQFRLGGHLALDRGEMVEIAAGRVDPGEQVEDAARRECYEETGTWPVALTRLFEFCPAPALSDELMTLFVAHVDASRVSGRAGLAHENEKIAVIRISVADAIQLAVSGELCSGPTVIALQWLARNWPVAERRTMAQIL
jgi:ADP-ribose pyrophosphatase